VLANLSDSFKIEAKNSKFKRSEIRRQWEQALLTKIHQSRSMTMDFSQFPSSESAVEKNLIYHIAGFVVKKASKLLDCQDCVTSLHAGTWLPSSAFLTQSLDRGNLTYPSTAFFELISSTVEPIVRYALENGDLYGDALLRIVKRISDLNPTFIGCEEVDHASIALCKLIPYYIMIRFHFYSQSVKQDITKLARVNRKLSKLQDG